MPESAVRRRSVKIRPVLAAPSDVTVYEYGCRLDAPSIQLAQKQIEMARRLYNDIVSIMRRVHAEMSDWVLERAGPHAREAAGHIEALNARFKALSAGGDEQALSAVVAERLAAWREQSARLKAVRAEHADEIKRLFLSRVANNARAEVYQCRCDAVDAGLGWGTANAVLERALIAWNQSMSKGQPPRHHQGFAIACDTLSLRFNTLLLVERLLAGTHPEIGLVPGPRGCGKRAYGEFRFRLGPAGAKQFAIGSWQHHRPLPAGAQVTRALLVRRKVADRHQWSVQLLVREAAPVQERAAPAHRLNAIQFGWSANPQGRYVAAVASSADAHEARACHLPADIEADLARAASLAKQRLRVLKTHQAQLASLDLAVALPVAMPAEHQGDGTVDQSPLRDLAEQEVARVRADPQGLGLARIYRLQRVLRQAGWSLPWLDEWLREDRKAWQASVLIARRARGRRRDFYRRLAAEIVGDCSALAWVAAPASEAKVNRVSGRPAQAGFRARAGRLVASVSELQGALQAMCTRLGVPLFVIEPGTLSLAELPCPACESVGLTAGRSWATASELSCAACGATVERKKALAARAWDTVHACLDDLIAARRAQALEKAEQAKVLKLKILDQRAAARAASAEVAKSAADKALVENHAAGAGKARSRLGLRVGAGRKSPQEDGRAPVERPGIGSGPGTEPASPGQA